MYLPNRIIKESICISEDIDALSSQEEAFFYRLLVNCDDYGRMEARPQIVRAKCYPLRIDNVSLEDIKQMLAKLSKKLITLYEVDEKLYLQVNTWAKHQNIRANKSKFPSIDEGKIIILEVDSICNHLNVDEIKCKQMQANVPVTRYSYLDTRNSVFDNMPAPGDAGDSGNASAENPDNESGGAQEVDPGKSKHEYTDDFEEFWSCYPRKTEKAAAFAKWKARLRQKVDPADMIKAAQNYAEKCRQDGTEVRFIKHAKTFLGESRSYEEYIDGIPKSELKQIGNSMKSNKPTFNNFKGRDYDVKKLEEALKKKGREGYENISDEEIKMIMEERRKNKEKLLEG